ncbi:MAG: YceI family protein [Rhodothermales bacterium]
MFRFLPMLFLLFAAALLMGPVPSAHAQSVVPFADSSRIWVDGTSSRSDWTVYAPVWSANLTAGDGVPAGISLTVDVAAMESRKSTIMDRLMHRTFNVASHPEITFTSSDMARLAPDSLLVTGDLTMAGQTQRVDVRVHADSSAATYVVWSGRAAVKMTDYGMTPPTAMFGALHTADDVTVQFRLFTER